MDTNFSGTVDIQETMSEFLSTKKEANEGRSVRFSWHWKMLQSVHAKSCATTILPLPVLEVLAVCHEAFL